MDRLVAPTPLLRVLGAAASWFLFALCFTLLFRVSFAVMAIGGSCASGGPYQIEVECPDAVVVFAPLSIFGGLFAVAIGFVFARGFGTPLVVWAWPILFCGLGLAFLTAAAAGDPVGLIIGILFEVMGLVPLVLAVRLNPRSVLLGAVAVDGTPFAERAATALNWLSSLAITAVFGTLGVWVATVWFESVGG